MSIRAEVLLWAQRVNAKPLASAHALLEVRETASFDELQTAFHKIARTSHPDLHRTTLTPEELELVTSAYGKVASAYQDLRSKRMTTARIEPLRPGDVPATPAAPTTGELPKIQMSSKALVHYRKAEMALRRGDARTGVLHLKLAIAADPQSAFLRTALAEVEAELARG